MAAGGRKLEQQQGRIITALANRKDPKQWTP
jgi:hypothetical protein